MPVQNNEDLNGAVHELATALEGSGASQSASELRDALAISTLPGELLGEVRLTLQAIRDREVNLPAATRQRVSDAIAYIDRALGG